MKDDLSNITFQLPLTVKNKLLIMAGPDPRSLASFMRKICERVTKDVTLPGPDEHTPHKPYEIPDEVYVAIGNAASSELTEKNDVAPVNIQGSPIGWGESEFAGVNKERKKITRNRPAGLTYKKQEPEVYITLKSKPEPSEVKDRDYSTVIDPEALQPTQKTKWMNNFK